MGLPRYMGNRVEDLTHELIIKDLEARKFPPASVAELSDLLYTYQAGYCTVSYSNPNDHLLVGWGIFVPMRNGLSEHDQHPKWYGLSVFGSEKVEYGLYQLEHSDIKKRTRIVNTGQLDAGAAWLLAQLSPAMENAHACQVHLQPLADYIENQSMRIPGWERFVYIDGRTGRKDFILHRQRDGLVLRIGFRSILQVPESDTYQSFDNVRPSETLFMYFYNDKEIGGIEELRLITQEIVQIVTPLDKRH